jgi:hypothetical protein
MAQRNLHSAIRGDRDAFRRLVASLARPSKLLGLTHVTTGYIFREVLDVGKIAPIDRCQILKEPVIYAFYGRSAFRRAEDNVPTDLPFLFPVVCILDPAATPAPKYVFGFDTGAFVTGFMDDYLDPYMPLFDFQLEPNIDAAARLVEHFFGGANQFLDNTPRTDVNVPASNFEGVSYQKMIAAGGRGANKLDDRVSTPEVIFANEIDIAKAVKAVILPNVLSDDHEFGGRIATLGVKNDGYEWNGVTRPSEYHMLIRRRVRALYKEFGWI